MELRENYLECGKELFRGRKFACFEDVNITRKLTYYFCNISGSYGILRRVLSHGMWCHMILWNFIGVSLEDIALYSRYKRYKPIACRNMLPVVSPTRGSWGRMHYATVMRRQTSTRLNGVTSLKATLPQYYPLELSMSCNESPNNILHFRFTNR